MIKSNLDSILSDLRDFDTDAEEMISLALRNSAETVKDYLVANWPEDTGRSKAGWEVQASGPLEVEVVNTTDYAHHVHGRGEPPLAERLLDEVTPQAEQEFLEEISRAFTEALD